MGWDISGIYPLRGIAGCCHLLVDGGEATLLDTGLIGEIDSLRRLLHDHSLGFHSLRAIVLTHGHLDHTGNLTRLVELSGARVYAHPLEQTHIDGTYLYAGWSRGCGILEAIGRPLLRYRPTQITDFLQDGETLPFWGGLRVVHLPGHTAGHCGFYSARHDLLFSGDLFASYWFNIHQPPPFLNSEPDRLPESFAKVTALNPKWILPNHYDRFDGGLHRERFKMLMNYDNGPGRSKIKRPDFPPIPMDNSKELRQLLIGTSVLFSILAVLSLPLVLFTSLMCFDAPNSVQHISPYLGALSLWTIPAAFVGGQGIAWKGYYQKKVILIVLGMFLSIAPLLLLLGLKLHIGN